MPEMDSKNLSKGHNPLLKKEIETLKSTCDDIQEMSIRMMKLNESIGNVQSALALCAEKIGAIPVAQDLPCSKIVGPFVDQNCQIDKLLADNSKFFNYFMFSQLVAATLKVFSSEYSVEVEASQVSLANREKIVHQCHLAIPVSKDNFTSYLSLWFSEGFLQNLNASQGGDLNRFSGVDSIVSSIGSLLSYEFSTLNIFDVMPPLWPSEFSAPAPILAVTFTSRKTQFVIYLH
jgi:hypothetical protein